MLTSLTIKNYAIIESIEVEFTSGLTILTGETGAGKSILMGALGLILGDRANTSVLFDPEKKCYVEATFTSKSDQIDQILEAYDIDSNGDEVIIRREINKSGKSRAFVNDTPGNLALLQRLGHELVDLHRQFDTLNLNNEDTQRMLLDTLAKNEKLVTQYQKDYQKYSEIKTELEKLVRANRTNRDEEEFLRFQLQELESAQLIKGEQQQLEQEQKTLDNMDELVAALQYIQGYQESVEFPSVTDQLTEGSKMLSKLTDAHEQIPQLSERLTEVQNELEDLIRDAEHLAESLELDPERQQIVTDRLETIYKLQTKYQLNSVENLLEKQEQLTLKLRTVDSYDETISKLTEEKEKSLNKVLSIGQKLLKSRTKAAEELTTKVESVLATINMEHARLKVQIDPLDEPQEQGIEQIQLLFASNKGSRFQPLSDIASGGELARLALAIKNTIANNTILPTMVFDEIDAGVSGAVANKMGDIIKSISFEHQVLCITHSPQIAARADQHLLIYKDEDENRSFTKIKQLNPEERIQEIATILSGIPPSQAAIENAKELIQA